PAGGRDARQRRGDVARRHAAGDERAAHRRAEEAQRGGRGLPGGVLVVSDSACHFALASHGAPPGAPGVISGTMQDVFPGEGEERDMARAKTKPAKAAKPAVAAEVNGPAGEVLTLAEAAAYLRLPEDEVVRLVNQQELPGRYTGT